MAMRLRLLNEVLLEILENLYFVDQNSELYGDKNDLLSARVVCQRLASVGQDFAFKHIPMFDDKARARNIRSLRGINRVWSPPDPFTVNNSASVVLLFGAGVATHAFWESLNRILACWRMYSCKTFCSIKACFISSQRSPTSFRLSCAC